MSENIEGGPDNLSKVALWFSLFTLTFTTLKKILEEDQFIELLLISIGISLAAFMMILDIFYRLINKSVESSLERTKRRTRSRLREKSMQNVLLVLIIVVGAFCFIIFFR